MRREVWGVKREAWGVGHRAIGKNYYIFILRKGYEDLLN